MIKIQPRLLANKTAQFGRDPFSPGKETGGLSQNKVDGAGHGSIHSDPIVGDSSKFVFLKKGIEQLTSSFRNQGFGHFEFPQIGGQIGSFFKGIGGLIQTIRSIGNISNFF